MSNLSHFNYSGDNGDDRPFLWQPGDTAIATLLIEYPYLPSNWIPALLDGRGLEAPLRRIGTRLCREGTHPKKPHPIYIRREQQMLGKPAIYSLADAGVKQLIKLGIIEDAPYKPPKTAGHELLASLSVASVMIGAKQHGIEVLRRKDNDRAIRLVNGHYTADTDTLTLRKDGRELSILGIEADMGTEPLTSHDATRETIEKKYARLKEVYADKKYRAHHGIRNAVVVFVTTTEGRRDSLLQFAAEKLGSPTWLLFLSWGDFYNARTIPEPSGYVLETPCLRTGHSPFTLATFGE